MISGAHTIIFSRDATADRIFLRDALGLTCVDAGEGWLIFALPATELAVHPAEDNAAREIYFMCDDLATEMSELGAKGAEFSAVQEAPWGSVTQVQLPGGGEVGLYQPKHRSPTFSVEG